MSMNEILKYTENKKFIKWVLNNDKQLDAYWKNYLKNNSEEKENIDKARILVLQFKSKEEQISKTETDLLFSNIKKGIEKHEKVKTLKLANRTFLKYASLIVLFIASGFVYNSLMKKSEFSSSARELVSQNSGSQLNSQLILGNNQNITIKNKDCYIELLNDGEIVLNKTDTITQTSKGKNELNQLIIPQGNLATVKLTDGSIIYLNAESQLVFPIDFNRKQRQIYMVGEGFFEVAHNFKKPFVAITNGVSIEVLGTKFNISAYQSDKFIETFLLEGKIRVKQSDKKLMKDVRLLEPLQCAKYNKNIRELVVSDVNDKDYISWHKGYLNLESRNLSEIIKKLERYYKINITVMNQELDTKSISGKLKLKGENKDTVIQVLANTASLTMQKQNESTYILK